MFLSVTFFRFVYTIGLAKITKFKKECEKKKDYSNVAENVGFDNNLAVF